MAAFNGGVFDFDFPELTPRNVSSLPQSTNITGNTMPVPSDVYNYSGNYQLLDLNPAGGDWVIVQQSATVLNWPTRKEDGSFNNHVAPIGFDGPGFDWFEKVITSEQLISLGAFVSKSQDITVYSSYRDLDIQLDDIVLTTGAGTSITNAPSFPYTQPRQRSISVTFLATADGPAIINGDITFDYASVTDAVIPVTGQRIFILPWVPEDNIKERLEWATDIIKATNREQRRALRASPRITRSFRFYLSDVERMKFEKDIGNRGVLYTAPAWWDARYINNVSINDTVVNVDTDFSEFTDGGLCLFVEPETLVFEVKTILSVGSGTLTLNDAIENNFPTGFAVPVLPGVLINSTIKAHNQDHYFASVEIVSVEHPVRSPPAYPQVNNEDILNERSVIRKTIPISITKAGSLVDNKIGPVQFFATENRPRTQEKFEWKLNTAEERYNLKDWFYSRVGRQKQFLYSSWQTDFIIAADHVADSGILVVDTTDLEAPFYFQVELKTGTVYWSQCTSIGKGAGIDTLSHSPAIPVAFTVDEVAKISKMRLMRHSSDSVDITYTNYQKTAAALNMVEI